MVVDEVSIARRIVQIKVNGSRFSVGKKITNLTDDDRWRGEDTDVVFQYFVHRRVFLKQGFEKSGLAESAFSNHSEVESNDLSRPQVNRHDDRYDVTMRAGGVKSSFRGQLISLLQRTYHHFISQVLTSLSMNVEFDFNSCEIVW